MPEAFGILKESSDTKYKGNWHMGKRYGFGEQTFSDGICCKGHWLNDKMNGLFNCESEDYSFKLNAFFENH